MSLPLDSDGFLRRECPTCERELKWLSADSSESDDADSATNVPDGGYYCPYCAIQAQPDSWWTKPQLEQAESAVAREVVAPELEKLKRSAESSSSDALDISVEYDTPEEPDPLTETDDMRRVDFACHPNESVKVLEDWDRPVHCPICGTAATAGSAG